MKKMFVFPQRKTNSLSGHTTAGSKGSEENRGSHEALHIVRASLYSRDQLGLSGLR